MGKGKIAQTLCRAGLHLAPTTAGRILNDERRPPSERAEVNGSIRASRIESCQAILHQ
jgi:hypothetical protein